MKSANLPNRVNYSPSPNIGKSKIYLNPSSHDPIPKPFILRSLISVPNILRSLTLMSLFLAESELSYSSLILYNILTFLTVFSITMTMVSSVPLQGGGGGIVGFGHATATAVSKW